MSEVRVQGLREFRERLPDGAAVDREMRRGYSRIASKMQGKARSNASAGGGAFAAARSAVRGYSSSHGASIGVSNSGRIPFAQATFWGAKRRTGWYAAPQYDGGPPQFPEWVGNQWDPGKLGQGPYVINYTIAENQQLIDDEFNQSVDDMFAAAFND